MKKLKGAILAVVVCFCMLFMQNVYAAGSSLSGSTSVKNGTTFTVNINVNAAAAWNVKVSYDNSKLEHVSGDLNIAESKTGKNYTGNVGSVTFRAKSDGNAVISLTGELSDENKNKSNASGSLTTNVYTPVTPPVDGNSGSGNSGNSGGSSNTKSSNANLSSLKVNYEGMSPAFNASKTSYAITVAQDVTSLNVTAIAQDSKAKVSVSGNTNFKDGDNYISIVVTAQNGTKKTYQITVTRTADATKANAYLESLIVENATLSPSFEREVLEYDCGTIGADIEKLTILTFPENKQAKFEIIGNDKLVAGENRIVIKVTAPDGTTVKEYVIKVIKEEEATNGDAIANVDNNSQVNITKQDNQFVSFFKNLWKAVKANSLLVLMYLLVIVEFIQIVYLYRKVNRKDNHDPDNNITGRRLVKKDIKENVILEGSSAEQILNNAPRQRNATNQNSIKDLTEEKKELEVNELDNVKIVDNKIVQENEVTSFNANSETINTDDFKE